MLQTEVQFLHPAPMDEGASIAKSGATAKTISIARVSLQSGRFGRPLLNLERAYEPRFTPAACAAIAAAILVSMVNA